MEASRKPSGVILMFALIACVTPQAIATAASYRTTNFIVQAPSRELAKRVGDEAERFRDELAVYWTGRVLPRWPMPCPIRVVAGNLPAQGVTTYNPQPVSDFNMEVIGTPERILDSVLPHEVTHTVLATYFGRPLPRWADEGICTTVEHPSERIKHERKLREFLASRRGIAMNTLFKLTEYPRDVLPMYAQGYSVCQFLIAQRGPRTFIQFLGDYMNHPRSRRSTRWTENVRQHYGYDSLGELQEFWLAWVEAGSGDVTRYAKVVRGGGDPERVASTEGRGGEIVTYPSQIRLVAGNAMGDDDSLDSGDGWRRPAPSGAVAVADSSKAGPTSWYRRERDRQQTNNGQSVYQAAQPQLEQSMGGPDRSSSGKSDISNYSRRDLPAGQTWLR